MWDLPNPVRLPLRASARPHPGKPRVPHIYRRTMPGDVGVTDAHPSLLFRLSFPTVNLLLPLLQAANPADNERDTKQWRETQCTPKSPKSTPKCISSSRSRYGILTFG